MHLGRSCAVCLYCSSPLCYQAFLPPGVYRVRRLATTEPELFWNVVPSVLKRMLRVTGYLRQASAAAAVLPFAKRGDDRSNNLVRLQQLFPRIVAADYEQPKRVSEDCRHLLKRMLTPDPGKRVTIPEIMQHPWCGTHSCCARSMKIVVA